MHKRRKRTLSLLSLLLFILVFLAAGSRFWPQLFTARADYSSWQDEFKKEEPRWDYDYLKGAGYRSRVIVTGAPSALRIGVTNAANSSAYSDCSLHEKSAPYTTGILEMRLKASDTQGVTKGKTGTGKGTRGWGFWDGNTNLGNAAWFWSASSESDPQLQGFRTQVFRDGRLEHNQILDIDMRKWHIYRIEMTTNQVVFLVDGQEVARSKRTPSTAQRVEIWIDNYAITLNDSGYTKEYLDITHNQFLTIDWVRYTPIR